MVHAMAGLVQGRVQSDPLSAPRGASAGAAGATGVGVGSAVNRLNDELAMVAVVRGLREALNSSVAARV